MSHLVRLPVVAALAAATAGWLVTLLIIAVGVLAGASPAQAAACPGVSGVSVVVEFNQLGGGVRLLCDADGGGHTADRVLKDAGFSLDYVQQFPGFVCRIDGLPADDPCVHTPPADAYWGLWWSDGKTGKWSYSSLGAGSLTLPAGAYVAMVWDGSSGTVRPSVGAPAHATPTPTPTPNPTPTPTPTPTRKPTPSPTPLSPTSPPASSPASAATSKPPSKKPQPSKTPSTATPSATPTSATAQPTPSAAATEAAGATSAPGGDAGGSGGLPGWLPPVLVAALLVAAAALAVVRRKSS